jgi:hypothetical protein
MNQFKCYNTVSTYVTLRFDLSVDPVVVHAKVTIVMGRQSPVPFVFRKHQVGDKPTPKNEIMSHL